MVFKDDWSNEIESLFIKRKLEEDTLELQGQFCGASYDGNQESEQSTTRSCKGVDLNNFHPDNFEEENFDPFPGQER